VVGITAAAFSAAPAKDRWIRLRSPHLSLVSNASDRATRDVARRLERFVDALSSLLDLQSPPDVPATVMVFRNDASFAPFRPRQNGRTLDLSGYFQRADDENLIALSLDAPADEHPYRVIFHEYAHALTVRTAALWPLWLQEGMADFYSTFEADNRRVAIGQPIREHARLLREQSLLPLRTLFAVDRSSPLYLEGSQNIFYAESWVLVHYLMEGDNNRRRPQFARFIEHVSEGRPAGRAFADAFGTDLDALERDLRRYIADGRYVGVNITFDRPARNVEASIDLLSDADAEVLKGSLLMRVGRGDEAEAYFVRANALDHDAARLEESRGFLALSRAQYADAIAHLTNAIEQDPRNDLAHYYYAEALRREVMEQGRPLPPERARQMADSLRTVIRLNPAFARAYYLLGYVHFVTGEDLLEGIRVLETAIRLSPPHRAAMLTLASIHLKLRDYAAARATAQAIIDSSDATASLKAEAQRVLDAASQSLTGR
jgi:tetratricopeptide (TPR) repeat protein